MPSNHLIPARFIVLIGHLILVILLLWDRDESVKACIPWIHTNTQYNDKNIELIVGLSISLVLIIIEFIGFLSGISMFYAFQSLFSLLTHAMACVCLCYFITDVWDCSLFWWIFALFTAMPALSETFLVISVLVFKKI